MNAGVMIANRARKYAIMGSSKISPESNTSWMTKLMYSFTEIMFAMLAEPKVAKNWSMYGSMRKYANATPVRKQSVVAPTIPETYFFSFSFRPGSTNFQSW